MGPQRAGHDWATEHTKPSAQDPGLIKHPVSLSHRHPSSAGCCFSPHFVTQAKTQTPSLIESSHRLNLGLP